MKQQERKKNKGKTETNERRKELETKSIMQCKIQTKYDR